MNKILSVILIFSVLFCCNIPVSANTAESPDLSYVSSLTRALGVDLKVSEGTTRAEFIYDIMQLINANSLGTTGASFDDISPDDYFFDSVSSAVSMGIISAGTLFRPDDAITVFEASKIMVCALGMGFEGEMRGGYPSGYLAVAYSNQLFPDNINGQISAQQMFDIVLRFIDASPYVIDSVGSNPGDASYISNKTVLEYYHNIKRIEGVVTASENTGMYVAGSKVDKGFAAIDDVIYKTTVDADNFIAKNSEVFIKNNNGRDEIVFIREKDNKSVVIDGEDVFSVSDGKISYIDDSGKDKTVTMSAAPAYIFNNKADASFSASNLAEFDGIIELVNNNGDGKIDAVFLKQYEIIYVDSVSYYDKTIFDTNGIMKTFDSPNVDLTVVIDGQPSDFDAIEEGSVIKFYSSKDGEVQVLEVVMPRSVDGVFTSVNKIDKIVTVDDIDYKYDDYFENNYSGMWTPGIKMSFYLTDDNKVFAVSKPSDDSTLYGYLIAFKKNGTMDTSVDAKVLCEDGSISVIKFAPKVIIDGKAYKSDEIITDGNNPNITPGLVRYRLNADSQIRLIDTAENEGVADKSLPEDNNLTLFKYPDDVYSSIWYIQSTGMFSPYFKVTSSTKIFVVSDDETLDEQYRYTTQNTNHFNSNRYYAPTDLMAYNVSTVGEAEAILVKGGNGTQSVGSNTAGGVVISANMGMDEQGTECIIVTLYAKSSYVRLYLSDEMLINSLRTDVSSKDIPLVAGDYVRYISRSDDHITAISKDFDYSTKKVNVEMGNHSNNLAFYYGSVYDKSANLVNIAIENNPKITADITNSSCRYSLSLPSSYIVYDSENQTAYKGSLTDIVTYINNPSQCSKLFMRSYNGNPSDAVIYK